MARHPSAMKRHRQSLKRRAHNAGRRAQIRSTVRKLNDAITGKDAAVAKENLKSAVSVIMQARSRGVLHKRTAARRVARLSRAVHKAATRK